MKKHINLYDAYLEKQKKSRSKSGTWTYLVILLIIGSLTGVYGGKLMLDKSLLEQEIQDLDAYVSNVSNQESVQKNEAILKEIDTMKTLNDALDNIVAVFDEKQSISGEMIKQITQKTPNGVSLTNIGFNGATISLSIRASGNNGPSTFVDNILSLDFVETVDYKGYSASGNEFVSSFSVILKGDY